MNGLNIETQPILLADGPSIRPTPSESTTPAPERAEQNLGKECTALPDAIVPVSLRQWPTVFNSVAESPKPRVIDLFAGVGGLSLGAVRAGFDLALAVELDAHAMSAHKQNFPGYKHLPEDVSRLDGHSLLAQAGLTVGELDGLIGGPPCQGFSVIGSRSADDPRNSLFGKFFELVAQCRPKFFVAENVPNIMISKYDDIRQAAFDLLPNDYVQLAPIKLKASDYGAPTSRARVFFIGYRRDSMESFTATDLEIGKTAEPTNVSEALRGLPIEISDEWLTEELSWRSVADISDSPLFTWISGGVLDGVGDPEALKRYREEHLVSGCFGTRHSSEVRKRYHQLKPGEQDKISKSIRLKLNGLCPTLRAGTAADKGSYQAVRPIHPTLPRVITPREGARLQGFPDWYRFAPSKWHSFRQIGNSVSPILAKAVFDVLQTKIH